MSAASAVHAVPVSYDEAIEGDINYGYFAFEMGSNTNSGSTSVNSPLTTVDFDNFDLDVAAGMQVNSISYAFTNVAALSNSTGFGLGMDSGSGDLGDWEVDVLNDTSPVSIPGGILPLGEGSYAFDYYLWRYGLSTDPFGGTWDYTLTFEVGAASTVPVPAAVWLFGTGLLGLVGTARRKKTV